MEHLLTLLVLLTVVVFSRDVVCVPDSCPVLDGSSYGRMDNNFHPQGCYLKTYGVPETANCLSELAERNAKLKGAAKWHISFMGDSRIRQMYHFFNRMLPTYDLVATQHMYAGDRPQQEHASVSSPLLGFTVSHRWQTFPNESMEADLRAWTTNQHEAPDVLVTGQMLWTMQRVLSEPFETYKRNMTRIAKLLKDLSQHSTVIWWEQDYLKESAYHLFPRFHFGKTPPTPNIDTQKIKKYSKFVRNLLKGSDVVIWDSTHKVFDEFRRGCILAPTRDDRRQFWRCPNDAFHPGFLFVNIYIQQLLNFVCNPVVESNRSFCCTK